MSESCNMEQTFLFRHFRVRNGHTGIGRRYFFLEPANGLFQVIGDFSVDAFS